MKFTVAAVLSALLCTNVQAQTNLPKRTPEQQAAIKAAIQEAIRAEKARYVTKCAAKYQGPPRSYGQVMRQYDRCAREYEVASKNGTLLREKAWIRAAPAKQWTADQKARAAAAQVEKHGQDFLPDAGMAVSNVKPNTKRLWSRGSPLSLPSTDTSRSGKPHGAEGSAPPTRLMHITAACAW